ncbi:hypothetical protein D5S17_02125 [Pseudonocardiaceae bacterium YIM PH 21723]|nr:hypothetical protein D5S17_02125 [Pseudonocardiaceae bacterium YIM PH 21723]
MRVALRAVMSAALLFLFPLLALLLVGLSVFVSLTVSRTAGVYLAIAGLLVAIALVAVMWLVLSHKQNPPVGPRLNRTGRPAIWELVDELAEDIGTRAPDEIVMTSRIEVTLIDQGGFLFGERTQRYLLIGLPILGGISADELRALIAHELAHFGGGSALSRLIYRATVALRQTADRMGAGSVGSVIAAYARWFARTAWPVNRARERAADHWAVRASGPEATASVLRKMATLRSQWRTFNDRFLSMASAAKRQPDVLLGFRAFLMHPTQRVWAEGNAGPMLELRSSSDFDAHPSLRERIAMVDRLPDEGDLPPDLRPGFTLLPEPGEVVPMLEGKLLLEEPGEPASWQEIVDLAAMNEAREGLRQLTEAARESRLAPSGTLDEILEVLEDGGFSELIAPAVYPGLTGRRRAEVARTFGIALLTDAITYLLSVNGLIRHEVDWGHGRRVRTRQGRELDIAHMAGSAVDQPHTVQGLRQYLASMGVSLRTLPPGDEQERIGPTVDGVATLVKMSGELYDLVVFSTGILLASRDGIPTKKDGKSVGGAFGAHLDLPFEQLRRRPGNLWFAADELEDGKLDKQFMSGWRLVIRTVDGEKLTVRPTTNTEEHGQPLRAVSKLLGTRQLSKK